MKKETTGGVIPGEMSAGDVADQTRVRKTRGPSMYKPDKVRQLKKRGLKTGTSGVHVEQVIAVPRESMSMDDFLSKPNVDAETIAEIRELTEQVGQSHWEDEEVIADLKESLMSTGASETEVEAYMEDSRNEALGLLEEELEPVPLDKQREDALKKYREAASGIRERIRELENPIEEKRERIGETVETPIIKMKKPESHNKQRSVIRKFFGYINKITHRSPRNAGRKPKTKNKRDEAA